MTNKCHFKIQHQTIIVMQTAIKIDIQFVVFLCKTRRYFVKYQLMSEH